MGKCGLLDVSYRSFLSLSGFLLILNLFQQLKTKNVSSCFSGSFAPVFFLLYIFFFILWFLFIKGKGSFLEWVLILVYIICITIQLGPLAPYMGYTNCMALGALLAALKQRFFLQFIFKYLLSVSSKFGKKNVCTQQGLWVPYEVRQICMALLWIIREKLYLNSSR